MNIDKHKSFLNHENISKIEYKKTSKNFFFEYFKIDKKIENAERKIKNLQDNLSSGLHDTFLLLDDVMNEDAFTGSSFDLEYDYNNFEFRNKFNSFALVETFHDVQANAARGKF